MFAGTRYRECRYPDSHFRFAVKIASGAPTSWYSHPTNAHARAVASNFARSRSLRRAAGRQSTTTAEPSARRAKKSGACDTRQPRSSAHRSQNGWDAMLTTAASKSKAIT